MALRFRDEILPGEVGSIVKSDDYQLLIISSKYKVASDKVNKQIDEINQVVKQYDNKGMLIGEAPCTKDLIDITDRDFKVVSAISILAILLIIAFVLRSVSLPIILVAVIELAIFINMGIPYFTGTELPFIASICIGTIQLGSTVDYAILMTTRYKRERFLAMTSGLRCGSHIRRRCHLSWSVHWDSSQRLSVLRSIPTSTSSVRCAH